MTNIPIIMPQLGESIAEAVIVNYLVKPGDMVKPIPHRCERPHRCRQ